MFLTKIFLVLATMGTMDEKGWVSVERPRPTSAQTPVRSEGDWPVFVRQFGEDRILIRFPDEPAYVYPHVERGDLETVHLERKTSSGSHRLLAELPAMHFETFVSERKIFIASQEGALFFSSDSTAPQIVDLLYKEGNYWVRERLIASQERFYILQTLSEAFDAPEHLQFIHSFDLETREKNKVFHREISGKN